MVYFAFLKANSYMRRRNNNTINRNFLITLFLFSLLLRMGYLLIKPPVPQNIDLDAVDYDLIAQHISNGDGFGYGPDKPSVFRPPLYPYFLAFFYTIFGRSHTLIFIIQAILSSFIPLFVYLIGKKIFWDLNNGVAAILAAIYPTFIFYASTLMTETLFMLFICISLYLLLMIRRRPTLPILALAGLSLGLGTLCRATLALFVPLALCWIIWCWRDRWKKAIGYAVVISIVFWLVLTPWIVRNAVVFHKFIPVSGNSGHIFWLSFNPLPMEFLNRSEADRYVENMGEEASRTEVLFDKIASENQFGLDFFRTIIKAKNPDAPYIPDEIAAYDYFWNQAKGQIKAKPSRLFKKVIKDSLKFWYFFDKWGNYTLSYGLILPFSLLGMIWGFRRWRYTLPLYMLLMTLLVSEVIYHATPRFRVPFEPVFLLFAGAYLFNMWYTWKYKTYVIITIVIVFVINVALYLNADGFRRTIRYFAQREGIEVYPYAPPRGEKPDVTPTPKT